MRPGHFVTLTLSGSLLWATAAQNGRASENLLQNPGFEETTQDNPRHWQWVADSEGRSQVTSQEAHTGQRSLLIPGGTAVEQLVTNLHAGAYMVRCWVKSETDQAVTIVLQDPNQPAVSYTYADRKVPKGRWTQVEAFCALDRDGSLNLALGGMSSEFRRYHGGTSEMKASILLDDAELVRFNPTASSAPTIWDAGKDLSGTLDWTGSGSWSAVTGESYRFIGTPLFQDRHLAGAVRKEDGAVDLYARDEKGLRSRATLVPRPAFPVADCSLVRTNGKPGIRVTSRNENRSYTVWLSPNGVIDVEPQHLTQFRVQSCQLRYGLLPSFVGTDLCYAPERLASVDEVRMPSTQCFVGLREGNDSMLVAVWKSSTQPVSLSLAGKGNSRMIDALTIGTETEGFSLSCVEHPNLWHQEPLNEDWLGDYAALSWQRPFPARWMADFFVTAGGKASFRSPCMEYSFPIANAKTRLWGVWFEDWNHYPFYFDGARTIAHFEKSFVPNGNALMYFLEPAAADLYSPCEIVQQVLGKQQAAALFDFGANQLRQLNYSTPSEFIYDRPVCATTTRLSSVKKEEKPTVGVHLATHLYEFIREIRSRVDQYVAFFDETTKYLDSQARAHPEAHAYIAELQNLVTEAKSQARDIYATPLSAVQAKTDAMKKLLQEGKGDGFDCGNLDVRSPAGAQDDLCRRYNRLVLRLAQTAAFQCGNSPERAAIAQQIWQQSRQVLRRPTRWEPRRTLYFFEP